jgi:hypothetical protein
MLSLQYLKEDCAVSTYKRLAIVEQTKETGRRGVPEYNPLTTSSKESLARTKAFDGAPTCITNNYRRADT